MDFKFFTSFSFVVRPLVSEEKDLHLALASLIDVGNFIPDIDTSKNIDILPIAFNACVVNRANKNGDVIDTETALNTYKNFINKPINIEHNRQRVVGCVLSAGFSEFGSDLPLTEEEVATYKKPFNITLGGIIWKTVNQEISNIVEESNDPTGEHYQEISASWELGFNKYYIILTEGDTKNTENCEVVKDENEIAKLETSLKAFGGSGKTEDNKNVYRQVVTQVLPLGIGLTTNPAADVKGVAVKTQHKNEKLFKENPSNGSQIEDLTVFSLKSGKIMNLSNIKDINDEMLKELSASAVTEFIETELKKALDQHSAEKAITDATLLSINEEKSSLEKGQELLKAELLSLKNQLEETLKVQKAKEEEEFFNQRMSALEEEFDFDDEVRAEVAKEIKDLNEESFSAYHKKMKKMAKGLTKKQEKLPDFIKDKIRDKEEKEGEKCKASVSNIEEVKLEDETTEIIEKAQEVKEATLTSTFSSEVSMADKYKKAFDINNFNIKY